MVNPKEDNSDALFFKEQVTGFLYYHSVKFPKGNPNTDKPAYGSERNNKLQAPNYKWFDMLTTLSIVEG
jgi:hypothetical protein